jgi:hypothetical protein
MKYTNGEVLLSPNTIYWVQAPTTIGEIEKIDLLKKDVFIVDCRYNLNNISKLKEKKDESSAFFFNIDAIIKKSYLKIESATSVYRDLAQFISNVCREKSIVHTNIIDEKISSIFREQGLFYLEKNFYDRTTAVSTVSNLIKPLFVFNNRVPRPHLRIRLYPEIKYKVEFVDKNVLTESKPIQGILKDLSLNGMGIVLNDKENIKKLKLKNIIQIKINAINSILKIPMAYITRIDIENGEFGINYDINNNQMVNEDSSNYILKMIYNWMKEIIDKYGKIIDDDEHQ